MLTPLDVRDVCDQMTAWARSLERLSGQCPMASHEQAMRVIAAAIRSTETHLRSTGA